MQYPQENFKKIPHVPGVYQFLNSEGIILYIGKAKDLNKRVSSYFQKNKNISVKLEILRHQIRIINVIQVRSEYEALLLEAKLINKIQPKYNVIWKDDKHYIYIRITNEEFPKIVLSRKNEDKRSKYFGPFPSSRVIREVLSIIRKIIPFCSKKNDGGKPCFPSQLGLCVPCPTYIKKQKGKAYETLKQQYKKNIEMITKIFKGKTKVIEKQIKKQMNDLSSQEKFEEAAVYRNKIVLLQYLTYKYSPRDLDEEIYTTEYDMWKEEEKELFSILQKESLMPFSLRRIECYDISAISGTSAVGAMVVFINGSSAKKEYRRFKIKRSRVPNDSAMMSEIVQRRLTHKEWEYPDLLVLDGGTPQLLAIGKLLDRLDKNITYIGLAKRYEEIIIPPQLNNGMFKRVKLPTQSSALRLLQRIRDESHRFAHSYFTTLRAKKIFGNISITKT